MRLNEGAYDALKEQMLLVAEGSGYREARLTTRRLDVDLKAHEAFIGLVLDTGPRYSFGDVEIQQEAIRPDLMHRFLRFREGEPYSATQLLYTQFALDDSLYFSTVEVDAGDPDPATRTIPVSIRAEKSRPTFSIGGGYATDTGVRGTFGWTDSRVNDRGHRFRVEVKASPRTRQVDSRYDIPIGDPALERFSIEGQNTYDEPSDIKTSTTTLTPSVTRAHGRWQTVTSLAATRTTTDEGADKSTSNLLVPGYVIASVPKDYLGEVLFSRTFYAELLGSHTALGSDSNFLRLNMQSEHTFDLDFAWHLLLRGQAGAAFVNRIGDLPGIYRFFAGGDRSVRGFAYNSLSPKELVTKKDGSTELQGVGGRYLLTGSTEIVRDLPRNWAAAAFFDFGNAFNNVHDKLESAVGVGVRYRLTGVSIGVDVARPLSTPDHKLRLHLNITPKL
jgi:translocation and assembly module TamA